MRQYIIGVITFGLLLPLSVSSQKRVVYQRSDSLTVCRLLNEGRSQSATTSLPLFFARKFIGLPYVAHTLELRGGERLVVNTRELDCTTLVETVVALTLCTQRGETSWRAYTDQLRRLRYRDGVVSGYPSRIHYFTEWISENSRYRRVSELQQPNPPFTAVQQVEVSYMSRHPQSYSALRQHPEYVGRIREMEQRVSGQRFRYIPKRLVADHQLLRKVVSDGDIIAITCSKSGLDIAHLGFAVWHDGALHLLNASQLHKCVVDEPMTLAEYLSQHPSHTGIRIIRINH